MTATMNSRRWSRVRRLRMQEESMTGTNRDSTLTAVPSGIVRAPRGTLLLALRRTQESDRTLLHRPTIACRVRRAHYGRDQVLDLVASIASPSPTSRSGVAARRATRRRSAWIISTRLDEAPWSPPPDAASSQVKSAASTWVGGCMRNRPRISPSIDHDATRGLDRLRVRSKRQSEPGKAVRRGSTRISKPVQFCPIRAIRVDPRPRPFQPHPNEGSPDGSRTAADGRRQSYSRGRAGAMLRICVRGRCAA